MVWGMRLPDSFGQYWPAGTFEYDPEKQEGGWYDRLRRHYLAQPPEEQIRLYDYRRSDDGRNTVEWGASSYRTYVSSKFICEVGKRDPLLDQLPVVPIEVHEPPRTFDTEKTYPSLGSLITLTDGIIVVDEKLKAIIEHMEPGVHQFFPIEIVMPSGKIFPKKYYIFVVGQYFDSYLPERSDRSKKNFAGLVFSKQIFGDAQLWKERGAPAITFFSDRLKSEMDHANLLTPKLYKMKEL